jgi:hypothetical protein
VLEKEKERGRAIAQAPPPERNKIIAQMMFGENWQRAQMAMFMLMGSWGIAPGPPPGAGGPPGADGPPPGEGGPPPGVPPHGS